MYEDNPVCHTAATAVPVEVADPCQTLTGALAHMNGAVVALEGLYVTLTEGNVPRDVGKVPELAAPEPPLAQVLHDVPIDIHQLAERIERFNVQCREILTGGR